MDIKIKSILPNLDNKEIKSTDYELPKYNEDLPRPYYRSLIVGPSGSGKTNAILTMLKKQEDYLTKIFVISISVFNDPKQKEVYQELKNCVVFQTPDEPTLKTVLNEIQRCNDEYEKYKKVVKIYKKFKNLNFDDSKLDPAELIELYNCNFDPETLEQRKIPNNILIVDDAAGTDLVKSKYFQSVVIRLRHWRTSIMLTTQSFKLINNTYRRNCTFWMLYRIPDINQLKDIFQEIAVFFEDYEHFKKLYDYCVKDRYNFMYIDTNDRENPVRKNFNEVLDVKLK